MNHQFPVLSSFIIWSTQTHSELYFTHLEQPSIDQEKKNRLIGLVRGLINFTHVLCHGLNNEDGLKVVHSKNHKILFLQPEPSFYLAAVINLPQKSSPATSSKLSDTLNILSKQQPSTSNYEPSDTVLLNSLSCAAQEYLLLHGSMDLLLVNHPQQLRERLEQFWSVWLWRWNVGKTGCGAVDFHELFGGLQSPFLQSPKLPRALVHEFTRFATQICPNISILPILIHDQKVLYLPSPTELIHREDITTLVRYLLSLLGGSEAKRAQARSPPKAKPAQDEQNLIMKRLSTIDLASLANFQPKLPSTTFTLQPASDWAHRAFKWASTSLVLPVNPFDNAAEADSLDQLLRADIGLPPRTAPSQLLRIKSSLSNPELVTEAIPSPTPRPPQRAASSTVASQISSPTKLGYPYNLLMIYSPDKTPSNRSTHYPHNLENIYESMSASISAKDGHVMHPPPMAAQGPLVPAATGPPKGHPEASSSSSRSKHNPRSPSFNVENALADAMSERSIGNLAALESVPSQPFSTSSGPPSDAPLVNCSPAPVRLPSSSPNTTPSKEIEIYVKGGRLVTSVYWIHSERWMLAWVAEPSNDLQSSRSIIRLSEVETKEALLQARAVLDGFVECGWPEGSPNEAPKTPEMTTSDAKRRPLKMSRQRFLIRDSLNGGCFCLQSQPHFGWLSKNEIWPGKAIPPDEVEASLGLLQLLDGRTPGRATPGTKSLFEEAFLRTSSGQWIVSKKISHHHHHLQQQQHKQDGEERRAESEKILEAFLVLPRGFGTLIEADNEMRILESQSMAMKFSLS